MNRKTFGFAVAVILLLPAFVWAQSGSRSGGSATRAANARAAAARSAPVGGFGGRSQQTQRIGGSASRRPSPSASRGVAPRSSLPSRGVSPRGSRQRVGSFATAPNAGVARAGGGQIILSTQTPTQYLKRNGGSLTTGHPTAFQYRSRYFPGLP
ncbi:MAG: hypothetical protein AAF497_07615 [Planctomycetota bacterium]